MASMPSSGGNTNRSWVHENCAHVVDGWSLRNAIGRGCVMFASSRRQFLAQSVSLLTMATTGLKGTPAVAAMGPNDKFDLVVKGGEVLDPSQNLRAKRDIGIRFGVIEALEADIPSDKALKVLSASGKVVTPGLVDLHAHVF